MAREGAKVVFGDILDEEGMKLEAEVRELGGDVSFVHLDVTEEAQWQTAVNVAEERYGRLDILVNNAGILIRKGLEETTVEDWDRIMDINAKGVFLGSKSCLLYTSPSPRDRTRSRMPSSA